jgi:hypothetical protein
MFGAHRCAISGCKSMVARRHFLCTDHYALVPGWLRTKLNEAFQFGIAWKCHPTQDWLDLRSQAIRYVLARAAEKHGRPQGEQLPLISST